MAIHTQTAFVDPYQGDTGTQQRTHQQKYRVHYLMAIAFLRDRNLQKCTVDHIEK